METNYWFETNFLNDVGNVSAKSDSSENDFINDILRDICEESSDTSLNCNQPDSSTCLPSHNIFDTSNSSSSNSSENYPFPSPCSTMSNFSPSYVNNYFNFYTNNSQHSCHPINNTSCSSCSASPNWTGGATFECCQRTQRPLSSDSSASRSSIPYSNPPFCDCCKDDLSQSYGNSYYQYKGQQSSLETWSPEMPRYSYPHQPSSAASLPPAFFPFSQHNMNYPTAMPQINFPHHSPPLTTSSTPSPSQWDVRTPYASPLSNYSQLNSISSYGEMSTNLMTPERVSTDSSVTTEFNLDEQIVKYCLSSPDFREKKPSASRKRKDRKMQLWEFILNLLKDPCNKAVEWVDQAEGLFRVTSQNVLVDKWSAYRNRGRMNFEKLTRTIRFYYPKGFLTKIQGKQNLYKYNYNKLPALTGEVKFC